MASWLDGGARGITPQRYYRMRLKRFKRRYHTNWGWIKLGRTEMPSVTETQMHCRARLERWRRLMPLWWKYAGYAGTNIRFKE